MHSSVSNKNKLSKLILLFIVSILCVYDPWFNSQIRGIVLSVFLLSLIYLFYFRKNYSTNIYVKLFIILLSFTTYSILPSLYNNTFETGVFYMYIKMCLYFLICLFFAKIVDSKQILLKLLMLGIIFQIVTIVLCFFFEIYRDFIYSVHTVDDRYYSSEQAYRLYFFTSSSFFQLSLFFGFLFHFFAALYREKKSSLGILIAIFICGMFSGRAFLIFSFVTVVFYGLRMRFIPLYFIIGSLLIFIALHFLDNIYVKHALEPIINLISYDKIDTDSSDKLVNEMLFVPTLKAIVFGDGLYYNADGSYYMSTDSGIVRQFLYGGIIYFISCFLVMFYLISLVSKNWFTRYWKYTISTFVLLLIGNVKADVLMYPGLTLNLIFILLLTNEGKNDQGFHRIT